MLEPPPLPSSPSSDGPGLLGRQHHVAPRETRKRRVPAVNGAEASLENGPKRRTVPNELRKRTGKSCDLCKTRRVKCIRPSSSGDHESLAPCENCIRLQVPCQSALPRKTRIYGSVESLTARYKLLEGLVKGLFPGRNTEDNDHLVEIAREYSITIPSINHSELSSSVASAFDSGNLPVPLRHTVPNADPMPTDQAHGVGLGAADSPNSRGAPDMRPACKGPAFAPVSAPSNISRLEIRPTDPDSRATIKPAPPSERLYPNTQGVMSYLGPSSSFKFMVALREIVADMEKRTSIRDHFPSGRESMAIEEQASDDKDIEVDNDGPVPDSGTNGGINGPIAQPGPRFALFTTPGQSRYNAPLPDSWAVASPASANGSLRSRSSPHVEGRRSSIVDSIRDTLPSRQTSDMLVEAFFDYVHVNYVIFHRGMFQMQYESLFTSPEDRDHEGDIGPSDSSRNKIDMGWICCIYMVFVFGQQALKDKRPEQAPRLRHNYVKLAQKHFYQVLSSTSLSNVQALLIMQLYQHNSSERNASWMLLGCACRMAVSMGMHREGARGGFSPIERELRRRVWWTMYTFEKQLSLTLGRPSAIPEDGEVNVGLPDENYMDGKAYYQPGLLDNMLSLTDILIRIRKSFFAAADCSSGVNPGIRRDTHSQIQSLDPDTARTFISQLDEWFHKLPPDHQLHSNAKGSNHNRAAHLLHLIYYYAKQVVLRSYVLQWLEMELAGRDGLNDHGRAQTSAGDPHQKELCQVCLDAAVSSLSIIESLWENNQVDGVAWIDIYWAYHSGVMLLINLLRERHAVRHTRTTTTSDQPTREAQFAVESRAIIKRLVKIMHKVNLCKTMSVFATVTVKLARVVEVNLEDEPDDMHVPVVDLAAEAVHGLVPSPATAHNNLSDLNTANFWSMEHMAHTDTLLFNSWTEADFLFPMATDGTDEFGWMQL